MKFNYRTKRYLESVGAVLIESKYKVFDVNFNTMKVFINRQDTYQKRNGKKCHVEHHFGQWIPFAKEDINYGIQNYTTYNNNIYGLEETNKQRPCKYLKQEVKKRLVDEYKNILKNKK